MSTDEKFRRLSRRNSWMWALAAILIFMQSLAVVSLYLPDILGVVINEYVVPETQGMLAISLCGLALLFSLYCLMKQREMKELHEQLARERIYLESTRARMAELSAIFDVTMRMDPLLPLHVHLQTIADRLLIALQVEGACFLVGDKASGKLVSLAASGREGSDYHRWSFEIGEGIPGKVAETKESILLDHTALRREFPEALTSDVGLSSVLCLPLLSSGDLIGVLFVGRIEATRPFTTEDAKVVHMFGAHIANDIQRRRQLDVLSQKTHELQGANRRLSELHDLKRMLLLTVRSEIRAPLAGIAYHAELLSQEGATLSPEKHESYLRELSGQVDHLASFVDEITELLTLESSGNMLEMSPTNMNDIINDSVLSCTPAAAQRGVAVLTELQEGLPDVSVDTKKVSRTVHYSLTRAIRSSKDNGTIRITSRLEISPEGDNRVVVSIWDEEVGITPNRQQETHGLGLYLIRELVEMHGGEVWTEEADSALGLCLTLPVREHRQAPGEFSGARGEVSAAARAA